MDKWRLHRDDGVAEDQKVRTVRSVEMRSRSGRKMSSGREAPDADTVRLNMKFAWMGADEAYRLMGIVDHCRVMIAWPEAILEDERRYAARVCPLRDLLALMVHGQRTVAAAGTDDHACAGAFRRGRKIN